MKPILYPCTSEISILNKGEPGKGAKHNDDSPSTCQESWQVVIKPNMAWMRSANHRIIKQWFGFLFFFSFGIAHSDSIPGKRWEGNLTNHGLPVHKSRFESETLISKNSGWWNDPYHGLGTRCLFAMMMSYLFDSKKKVCFLIRHCWSAQSHATGQWQR